MYNTWSVDTLELKYMPTRILHASVTDPCCACDIGIMLGERRRRWPSINPASGQRLVCAEPTQQTRDVKSMWFQCWANVFDAGPTLKPHWLNVSCLLSLVWIGMDSATQVFKYLLIPLPLLFTNITISIWHDSHHTFTCGWGAYSINWFITCNSGDHGAQSVLHFIV